jgi:hypothetical protein
MCYTKSYCMRPSPAPQHEHTTLTSGVQVSACAGACACALCGRWPHPVRASSASGPPAWHQSHRLCHSHTARASRQALPRQPHWSARAVNRCVNLSSALCARAHATATLVTRRAHTPHTRTRTHAHPRLAFSRQVPDARGQAGAAGDAAREVRGRQGKDRAHEGGAQVQALLALSVSARRASTTLLRPQGRRRRGGAVVAVTLSSPWRCSCSDAACKTVLYSRQHL